jgi:hypothetical protein
MSRPTLRLPSLLEKFSQKDVTNWLGGCDDALEIFDALAGSEYVISEKTKILMAGTKMEGEGKTWWNDQREALKKLNTWAAFKSEVEKRFLSGDWMLKAEHEFYLTRQGNGDFLSFSSALLELRGQVSRDTISDDTVKKHLLHFSHNALYLRVTGSTAFKLEDLSVNELISHMSSVWSGLAAENQLRPRINHPLGSSSSTISRNQHRTSEENKKMDEWKDKCSKEGKCFKCGKAGHLSRHCEEEPLTVDQKIQVASVRLLPRTVLPNGLMVTEDEEGTDGELTPEEDW